MYLSRVRLNPQLRTTMQAIQAPQMLHGAVERCFAGERRRRLWRIDWMSDSCLLLVLSEEIPDFTGLIAQFSNIELAGQGESKDYEPFLSRLREGQAWHFRLKANPVVASRAGLQEPRQRGRIHAHVTPEQQKRWLMNRAAQHGFGLQEQAFDVVHSQWQRFTKKDGSFVSLRAVALEGSLRVEDAGLLRKALTEGIGRGKAYGLGLLTLAR